MLILPVLDLKQGLVVRGKAGQRSLYQPIESRLADSAQPGTVANAFVKQLGLRQAYVADLDAIAGDKPDWAAYRAIMDAGLTPWIDAGVGDAQQAAVLAEFSWQGLAVARVVAGLESLASPARLAEIVARVTPQRAVFSLDLKSGVPLLANGAVEWPGLSSLEVAQRAVECGVQSMIVLDLARVGMASGAGTHDLCRQIRTRWPKLELIGGGGVRSLADLQALHAAGYDAALVASSLHDGMVTAHELTLAAAW